MRPRHKAAENARADTASAPGQAASMRPRHKAAENVRLGTLSRGAERGFNEAAA